MNAASKCNRDLIRFLTASPSPFHAIAELKRRLTEEGYETLREEDRWQLKSGGKYLLTRNDTSLIAFRIPSSEPSGFMISAAHSDAPAYKIKHHAELSTAGIYTRLSTEPYGGMICSSWMDRPLSVAGRVVVKTESGVASRLVHIDRDLLLIPSVAIHMNRSINSGYTYNQAVDMIPLFGDAEAKGAFPALIAKAAGVKKEEILSSDLFLYVRSAPSVWGNRKEFLSAPRLDDLQCAYGTAMGFLASTPCDSIPILAIFDNEEVGSSTKQGAASPFLAEVLVRICNGIGMEEGASNRLLACSMMVSADNAHALHPNHPEYADSNHRPAMNGGIVVKHNAQQRYATDALSAALFKTICEKDNVPIQYFFNRSDLPGGSTLGSISNTRVPLCTVDIGLPQLSMHSAYETAGCDDTAYLITAMSRFFSCSLRRSTDGGIDIAFAPES